MTVPDVAALAGCFAGACAEPLANCGALRVTSAAGVWPAEANSDGPAKAPTTISDAAAIPAIGSHLRDLARVATCLPRLLPTLRQYWTP